MATLARMVPFVVLAGLAGCGGGGLVRSTGQLVENGQPVALAAGESVRLDFTTEGAPLPLSLEIYVQPDGSFATDMNDGSGAGLPPGKYTVKLNREYTTLNRKADPKLFKVAHPVEIVPGAALHLKVDLAKGTIAP